MQPKAKVLLVDDHPLVREWLGTLINQQPDLEVCGEVANAPQALGHLAAHPADIAIVDISMDGGSGLELIKSVKIAHPHLRVIVLSMHDEEMYAERALRAGARGYIMKREATKRVLEAIRAVLAGRLYLSDKMTAAMAERFVERGPRPAGSRIAELSDRELEVFELLGRGQSTRQIADDLHVSFKTVQAFCARIKEKLQVANATELLVEAVRWHDRRERP